MDCAVKDFKSGILNILQKLKDTGFVVRAKVAFTWYKLEGSCREFCIKELSFSRLR